MSSVAEEIVQVLKPIGEALRSIVDFLVSEPAIAFCLSFILILFVVREAYGRGGRAPFSMQTATIIALVFAIYGASVLATKLPLLSKLAAYAVLIGLPLILAFRFLGKS